MDLQRSLGPDTASDTMQTYAIFQLIALLVGTQMHCVAFRIKEMETNGSLEANIKGASRLLHSNVQYLILELWGTD